jgi:DNA (cytosine-5)-methyltransferase 1
VGKKHLSLFNGIGGFQLAAKWAGWENIAHVEIDEWCNKVTAKNFPKSECHTDIYEFNGEKYNGTIDIISGGFPCQPFSNAGKRQGEKDNRFLWFEMLRVIREIQPTWVVAENVSGLVSMENGKTLEKIFISLENEGYTVEPFIIPASAVGAWHKRERIWITAYTNSVGRENEQKENRKPVRNGKRNGEIKEQSRNQQQCRISESSALRNLANSEEINDRKCKHQSIKRQTQKPGESNNGNAVTTNCDNSGCEKQREQITNETEYFAPKCGSWWKTEPGVGRVVDGLPNRVDRIKGLGNAIVPQVAYEIFAAINQTGL